MDDIEAQLDKPRLVKGSTIKKEDLLHTGSTLLNLALTGDPDGGFAKGKYYFIVGDSSSGKTFMSRTCLAEATINPQFDGYRLIYDDVEGGALMDTQKFFPSLMDRIETVESVLVEDFYYNIDDAVQAGKPFIYVVDSMDALSSKQEDGKFDEKKTARRKGKETTGEMTDGKAKVNSSNVRRLLSGLRDTKSILIILNQTRDNMAAKTIFDPKKVRSGGRALTFYATAEIWMSVGAPIRITVNKKPRKIGVECRAQVKKNRSTGREGTVSIPFFYSTGIDDVGGMVDYLVEENKWSSEKGVIDADDFDVKKRRESLVEFIQEEGLEFDLKQLVLEMWNDIEKACQVKRKNKYGR